eukprot:336072_1
MSLSKIVITRSGAPGTKISEKSKHDAHGKVGAKVAGYDQPLIRGVFAFSYGYSLILDKFTNDFLKCGYIKLTFLKPFHPNQQAHITLDTTNKNDFKMKFIDEATKALCIVSKGSKNMNSVFTEDHFFGKYANKNIVINDDEYSKLIDKELVTNTQLKKDNRYKLHDAYLKIYTYNISKEKSIKYSKDVARDNYYEFVHIGFLLDFLNNIIYASFPYKQPVIHAQSEIQFINYDKESYLRNMRVGQTFKTYGKIVKLWKKKQNYWILVDGIVTDQFNNAIAIVRHKSIYDSDNYKLDAKL